MERARSVSRSFWTASNSSFATPLLHDTPAAATLRLMENFQPEEVHDAVRDAIRLGAVSFDAVKHLVLCRIEGRPPRLDMELYPYLPRTNVATTSTRDYMALLAGSRS